MNKYLISLGMALLLAACATATPYGPAGAQGGYGFSDQQLDESRFRITFRGNSSTARETVENSLLYRAAELTVERGFDYFVVVENDTERDTRYSSSAAFYGRYGYGYPFYRSRFAFPYYAYGFGWGGSPYNQYTREINRYTAIAFVSMHNGEKPDDVPGAFTAREVLKNLGPVVLGPAPTAG